MPEPNMADTIEEKAAADTAANQEANTSAEYSSPRTFTADEVDAKIKARIDKQNSKHAEEIAEISKRLKELEERSAAAESERDELKRKQELADMSAAIATEYDVPAYMLHGENQEELTKSAEAAAAYKKEILAGIGTAPIIKDSGEPKKAPKSGAAIFGEFMNSTFSK